MADPEAVREAMRALMKANKPNSGHRPPGLTVTEDSHRNCLTCVNWDGRGTCKLYGYKTRPNQVSESWAPRPT